MSGGYVYGDKEPVEECGCCGGEARAEYCDVGIGYAQVSEFRCIECGATPEWKDGKSVWTEPERPSERGERVTGYLITASGNVHETTFEQDHQWLFDRMGTTQSREIANGAVRITNLEGFAIDLPPFMTQRARRALARIVKDAEWKWGSPYVMRWGAGRGEFMTRAELAVAVSKLPEAPAPAGPEFAP